MIGADQGRIFEVGFNIGILSYLQEQKLAPDWVNYYRQELQKLNLDKMCHYILKNAHSISCSDRQIITTWSQLLLLQGFLGGYHFFREYLDSTQWKVKKVEILYYQCCFSGKNSLGIYPKDDQLVFREWLSRLEKIKGDRLSSCINQYQGKGEFLRADTLLLLRYRKRDYRILAVDASVFALQSTSDLQDLQNFIPLMKQKLIREVNYQRSKSVFSKLRIDTGETTNLDFAFSPSLKDYFTAFKTRDKESAKLIQAGGYAYSFYQFLRNENIIPEGGLEERKVVLSAMGYSDRGMNTMTANQKNIALFKTCNQIYKSDFGDRDIPQVRKKVFNQIKRQIYRSFNQGKRFVEKIVNVSGDRTTIVTHHEHLDNFFSSVASIPETIAQQYNLDPTLDLRDAHAKLINRELISDRLYLFLTGNPGIGKTTAIANFLKDNKDEGFLFLYVSPRKQVNLDILEKFKDRQGLLCDRDLFFLNTNSQIISENGTSCTVQYSSDQRQGKFAKKSVTFLDSRETEKRQARPRQRTQRQTEDVVTEKQSHTVGVIKSMCEAVHTLIDTQTSNKIVASLSIQSLKKTQNGKDTLEHFGTIFKGAYNSREQCIIPQKMQEISKRIKHLFIMIDEITGDDSGVEFLNRISQLLQDYELTTKKHGFNTKIIIADASIIDKDIIQQHLHNSAPEPDKIYFRKADLSAQSLSVEEFRFKSNPAILVNANSYPASSLDITYHCIINSAPFQESDRLIKPDNDLQKKRNDRILKDIDQIYQDNPENRGQILIYIQNKQCLQELIQVLKVDWETFEKNQDYLEVHSSLAEAERQTINQYKDRVKVIFMTSSGSRGLSFPGVKHLLVDVPRFQVEKNLMEIIQVIYRGRGNKALDNQPKQLIFYFSERAIYYNDNPELSLQESRLSILNILLLLKVSMMTRIRGSGKIGRENYLVIPIGGKSVSTAGSTLSSDLGNLRRKLNLELGHHPEDIRLKQVRDRLKELLSQADFSIPKTDRLSYISNDFTDRFLQSIKKNLEGLVNFSQLSPAYLHGSLLLVPQRDRVMEECYTLFLDLINNPQTDQLWKDLQYISHDDRQKYHENLKFAIATAIDLVDRVREEPQKSQRYEQQSQQGDRYYALPLLALLAQPSMKQYLEQSDRLQPTESKFHCILEQYLHSLYPVGNILPIGDRYENFPFMVFSSYSLAEIRDKFFTDKYLLNSHELNILNLILAKDIQSED